LDLCKKSSLSPSLRQASRERFGIANNSPTAPPCPCYGGCGLYATAIDITSSDDLDAAIEALIVHGHDVARAAQAFTEIGTRIMLAIAIKSSSSK
jgi:hypothetical protein